MSLEKILLALKSSTNNHLSNLDESILEDQGVQHILTTLFAEQEARPELTSLIRAPSLMYEYLQLSLEEREKVEWIRKNKKGYLEGRNHDRQIAWQKNQSLRHFIRDLSRTNLLLQEFKTYIYEREEDKKKIQKELAGICFLEYEYAGEEFKKRVRKEKLYIKLFGSWKRAIDFASEIEPEIIQYRNKERIFTEDGPKQLLQVFDWYLNNRYGEPFDLNFLDIDPNYDYRNKIKDEYLKRTAQILFSYLVYSREHTKSIVQLAAKKDERILDHFRYPAGSFISLREFLKLNKFEQEELENTRENRDGKFFHYIERYPSYTFFGNLKFKSDNARRLLRHFHHYLDRKKVPINQTKEILFGKAFLSQNDDYWKKFFSRRYQHNGKKGFDALVELISEIDPRIKNYTSPKRY